MRSPTRYGSGMGCGLPGNRGLAVREGKEVHLGGLQERLALGEEAAGVLGGLVGVECCPVLVQLVENAPAGDEYVVTDELGIPVHPETYSDEFTRMLKRAGLPKIRLHDSRHTTLSLMEKAGVPISIISKWAGHYDSSFTMKTYVHASDDDLKQGRQALAKIHRII